MFKIKLHGGKTAEVEESMFWHSSSHILAQAVKRLFPNVKLAIGPSIEKGFYYDFEHEPFSREDLDKIEAEMKKVEANIRKNTFTFEDFLIQFEQIGKMGSLADIISMIPGAGSKFKVGDVDEARIKKYKAIIQSMTKKERAKPDIINASRRKRIAAGAGVKVEDVNRLLKQYEQMKKMFKQMNSKGGKRKFGRGMNMPGMPGGFGF